MRKHIIGNSITNFENPSVKEIIADGWTPIYENGKIVDWIATEQESK